MAWVVESDGSASLRADELGDLLSSKVRVVVERATWGSTGYLFSQAANTASNRELGLYILNSQFQLYAGGQSTSLATTASLTIDDDTVDLTVDYVNETAILIVGGVEYFNGAINVGTGRFTGTPFVFFARAGGYDAPSGTRVGNTQVYIDDVLTYNYDFDNSSHGVGTVTVDETISANDAIATGLPTDGSAWVDLGSDSVTGEVNLITTQPTFNSSGSATLPQPNGIVDLIITEPAFSASGSVTIPYPQGEITFAIDKPVFNASGSSTQPNPSGNIDFTISKPAFSVDGSATLPQPSGIISFSVSEPIFNASGSSTVPYPVGDIDLVISEPLFSASGNVTLPNPNAVVLFVIDKPLFAGYGTVSGIELPIVNILTVTVGSNSIKLPYTSNVIKI